MDCEIGSIFIHRLDPFMFLPKKWENKKHKGIAQKLFFFFYTMIHGNYKAWVCVQESSGEDSEQPANSWQSERARKLIIIGD